MYAFFETACNYYHRLCSSNRGAFVSPFYDLYPRGLSKEHESSDSARVQPMDLTLHTVVSGPRRNNIPTPAQHLWSPLLTALPQRRRTRQVERTYSVKWHLFRYSLNYRQTILFVYLAIILKLNISCIFLCFAIFNYYLMNYFPF